MGDITGWLWNFGDGNSSTEQNPVHTYQKQGNYSVSLTVTGPAGTSTMEEPVFILVGPFPPVAYFEAIYTSHPAPCGVEFQQYSEGTITQWLWDFGDGTKSAERKPIHSYQRNGNFTVNLTVTGPEGASTKSRPSFIHVGEPFFIYADPIEVHSVGEKFTLAGTTNLPVGEELDYYVGTSSFNPGGPRFGNPSNASGTALIVTGNSGNSSWSFTLDTKEFRPDEYLVDLRSTTFNEVYSSFVFTLVKGKHSLPGQQATGQQTSPASSPANATVSLLPSDTHPAPLPPIFSLLAPGFAGMVYAAMRSRRRSVHE
jgi:PKD repeat protein